MAVTASEIADALAGRFGPIRVDYRFSLVTASGHVLDDLTPAVIGSPTIELDIDRAITRTMTIDLLDATLPSGFDTLSTLVAPTFRLLVGTERVDLPLGIFRVDVDATLEQPDGSTVHRASGSDLGVSLVEDQTPGTYTAPAGTNHMEEVERIVIARSPGLRADLPTVAATLPVSATWDPGTSWWAIVRDLLDGINYHPLWPRADGVFVTAERVDPRRVSVAATYSDAVEPRMIQRRPITRRRDRVHAHNRVVVITDRGDAVTRSIISGPLSRAQRGVISVGAEINGGSAPISTRCAYDAAVLPAIAAWYLRDEAARADQLTLATLPDPRREAHDLLTIAVAGTEGRWRSLSWRLRLGEAGMMQHTLGLADPVTIG